MNFSQLGSDIVALLKVPVAGKLDTTHLFLLIGLVLVMVAAWVIIMRYVETDVAEVV
jgi:hypothetical protein